MPRMFTKPTQVSTIWRFYMDQNKQWHWQRIGMDHTVLSEPRRPPQTPPLVAGSNSSTPGDETG